MSRTRLSLAKRLQPAKKAWKSFSTKLLTKLNKFNRSKGLRKPRDKLNKNTQNSSLQSSLSLFFTPRRKRQLILKPSLTLHHQYYRRYLLKKRHPLHVYIDDLFKQPDAGIGAAKKSKGKRIHGEHSKGGTGEQKETKSEKTCSGDDMWESIEMASPQMHGIDQRAENFIVRFRAEMELQETMAHKL